MSPCLAVVGAGPGTGRAVGRRFGREGFSVALVARREDRLDRLAAELAADGIEAVGFAADVTDARARTGVVAAIEDRFGTIDVLEYAPAGMDQIHGQVPVRDLNLEALDGPLELLLHAPMALVGVVLPGMIARGNGTVLFGLPVTATRPVPQLANVGVAAAAARAYLQNLHADLDGTGVFAGLVQVAGMVAESETAIHFRENVPADQLPEPLDPARIADALWELSVSRTEFERVVS